MRLCKRTKDGSQQPHLKPKHRQGSSNLSPEVIPKDQVFSIEDGEHRTLLITGYWQETVHFPEYSDPAWTTTIPPRTFKALRIAISEENEVPRVRHYWIDSKRLIGALLPLLLQSDAAPRRYLIVKHGIPPKSWYEVSAI